MKSFLLTLSILCCQSSVNNSALNKECVFDWQTLIALFALIVSLFPYLKRSTINGKVISYTYSKNGLFSARKQSTSGILYYFKIAIHCSNKDFYFKDVRVSMKYKSAGHKQASVFYARDFSLVFDDGHKRKLKIDDLNNYLPFETHFRKNTAKSYHITFIVPNMDTYEDYEEMIISFIPFSGKEKMIVVKANEMKENVMLYDDSIWFEE